MFSCLLDSFLTKYYRSETQDSSTVVTVAVALKTHEKYRIIAAGADVIMTIAFFVIGVLATQGIYFHGLNSVGWMVLGFSTILMGQMLFHILNNLDTNKEKSLKEITFAEGSKFTFPDPEQV